MLLIDVYNVLHLPEVPPGLEGGGVDELCRLLGRSRHAGRRAVAVCDGGPPAGLSTARGPRSGLRLHLHGTEVHFVGHGRSADDEIEHRLMTHRGRQVVVVSTDRRLRRAARRARARSIRAETFLAQLLLDSAGKRDRRPGFASDTPLDRHAVAAWMYEFGVSPGDVPSPASNPPDPRPARPPSGRTPPSKHEPPKRGPPALGGGDEIDIERVLEDPLLREAVREWGDRLPPDQLDMRRWLEERGRGQR